MGKISLVSFLFVVSLSLKAETMFRIHGSDDPAKRCMNEAIDVTTCETIRKKALEINCIFKEEYEALKRYGSYPSCNLLKGDGPQMLDGWCSCGCFAPDTLISVILEESYGTLEAGKLVFETPKEIRVVHSKEGSTLDHLMYEASPIRLKTYGKESKEIYRIKTKTQKDLLLTEKHPVLVSTGVMKQAKDLNENDKLVRSDGEIIPIVSIDKEPFKTDVVNFSVESTSDSEHLIIAHEILVGDQYWQASLEDKLNQIHIRGGKYE